MLRRILDHVRVPSIGHGLLPRWVTCALLYSLGRFTDAFVACNAKVLTVYERQTRLSRNFLEGARKKRMSYTPRGLYEAWRDLDAARKVYFGTLVGLAISVRAACLSIVLAALIQVVYSRHHTVLWFTSISCVVRLLWNAGRFPQVPPRG
jgi:hypothetical protein